MRLRQLAMACGLAAALALATGRPAGARPLYFETFTAMYGLAPGDDLYACGVCHRKWEGTGARNPFGTAVEQQLYIGKTIATALADVAGDDTDRDGFTNGDELAVYRTLPGYSCSDFTLVINPPPFFQSIITPGVPSCLEPHDIRIEPTSMSFVTEVGTVDTATVEVFNNGASVPLTVTSFAFLAGSNPAFSVTGPPTPLVIDVGQSVALTVSHAPTGPSIANGTLRVTSDDPDEPSLDVMATGLSFTSPLAPAADRAACLADVERQMERYTKVHLKEWGACFIAELGGVACDTARRDLRIGRVAAKLRAAIGGASDRACAGKTLTPLRLGLPATCGGSCGAIPLDTMARLGDCLVCRQADATNGMLAAAAGTVPPDLPANHLGREPLRCNRALVQTMQKGIRTMQKKLGACAAAAITAPGPVDCAADLAAPLAVQALRIDAEIDRCSDTSGMLGCLFAPMPDPQCLGSAGRSIASDLVGSIFGPE